MAHFYEQAESGVIPRHFVEMASRPGELRPTRITDVRKWWKDGKPVVPSVTTVLSILNKHGLNNWKIDQHLRQAHTINPDQYSLDDYIFEVKRLTEIEMDKAPSAGTNLHDKLELYLLDQLPSDDPLYPMCENALKVVNEKTGNQEWEAEKHFTSPLGFGGCSDLVSDEWVIDYKTKQTADKFKPGKMAYDEHRMQLAAYRMGLDVPCAKTANVFICLETGDVDFHAHSEEEINKGWRLFSHSLDIWKIQNSYPEAELMQAFQ